MTHIIELFSYDRVFSLLVIVFGGLVYFNRTHKLIVPYLNALDLDKHPQPMQKFMPINIYFKLLGLLFVSSYVLFIIPAVLGLVGFLDPQISIVEFIRTWCECIFFLLILFTPVRVLPEIPFQKSDTGEQDDQSIKLIWYLQILFYTWIIMNIYHQFVGIKLLKGLRLFVFPKI